MEEQEIKVLNNLADAWNEFLKLKIQHPDDEPEFKYHIHAIQNIVMARKAAREHPEYFFKYTKY